MEADVVDRLRAELETVLDAPASLLGPIGWSVVAVAAVAAVTLGRIWVAGLGYPPVRAHVRHEAATPGDAAEGR